MISMVLTNRNNLPLPLVEAVRNDPYDRGDCDFSVTELILPPRIGELRRQHRGEITEDASDRIFALLGQAIHTILERVAGERYLVEKRFTIYHKNSGVKVSGRIDCFDQQTRTLADYKLTSRYATKDGIKPEWEAQGNLNRLLMEKNDTKVKKIEFWAIYRDWSKMAVSRGVKEMPLEQVQAFEIPMWDLAETEAYLDERIQLHQEAAETLPLCTDEERWYKPAKWAVMKKGREKAIRGGLCASEEAAAEMIAGFDDPKQYRIEYRKGEHQRCMHYCDVAPFCSFFKELLEQEHNEQR